MLQGMRHACAAGLLLSMLAAPAAAQYVQQATYTDYSWLTNHPTIQQLLALHNNERARSGLPPLTLNPEMCAAAQNHAVRMAQTGMFQHSGLPYRENIFQGPTSPEGAVQGWIYSPAHRANMLSGYEAGFGYMSLNGRACWVAVFR